jgi:hypothetical protein
MLPEPIAGRLKQREGVIADAFGEVTVLSCVGFGWYEGRAMGLRKGERLRVRLVRKC